MGDPHLVIVAFSFYIDIEAEIDGCSGMEEFVVLLDLMDQELPFVLPLPVAHPVELGGVGPGQGDQERTAEHTAEETPSFHIAVFPSSTAVHHRYSLAKSVRGFPGISFP
jgi:hypothetical protein